MTHTTDPFVRPLLGWVLAPVVELLRRSALHVFRTCLRGEESPDVVAWRLHVLVTLIWTLSPRPHVDIVLGPVPELGDGPEPGRPT